MFSTTRLGRLLASGEREKKTIALSFGLLVFFRLRNLLLPYRLIKKRLSEEVATEPSAATVDESLVLFVTETVEKCSRFVPGANCLVKALAIRTLLGRYGQHSNIRLGVIKSQASIYAHAWVEIDGRIVFGMRPNDAAFNVLNPPSLPSL